MRVVTSYCNLECQKIAWPTHKGPCKEAEVKKAEAAAKTVVEVSFSAAASASASTATSAAASAAAEATRIQTQCAAAGCGEPATKRYTLCAGAFYCGRKCQKAAWPAHKAACKIAEKQLAKIGSTVEIFDAKIAEYKRLAEAWNALAQQNLALCYFNGSGIAVDKVEAFKWYKRAAEAGHKETVFNIGVCYNIGKGIAVDKVEAFKWFTRSSETGLMEAQYYLGFCYETGSGVAVDIHAAAKWYKLIVEASTAGGDIELITLKATKDALARLSLD